ncbi:ATP-binding cassette domain-containing protein [Pelomonas sp. V22]|uniref:ATP-binding cassette domain-containing protein n=1 Tax=Pelomonas sp. V22 TaxID=2822139 RepID=UPI0024A7CB0B|nr:ATP-binding cassette domain-containing protein [Pelomonas sp. V22]MDI4632464.1 ATP-binding cassette domain-containing protein [Pelomonas sp. V22]
MSALMNLNDATLLLGQQRFGPFRLTLQAGERVAILGPSGAGKSTLLKLLARELAPASGELVFEGRPLSEWSVAALARRRAVLPQSHAVAFGLPVELVVALGRVTLGGEARQTQQARIVELALLQAQAAHLTGRRFDSLSGGEQARVQLARVFAQAWDQRAGLLLFDEPLAALDPGLTLELMQAMQQFAAERGHALVAVLHDLNIALNHFERLWLLRKGRILADCDAVPACLPLLEQLYGVRLRLLRDAEGMAVLASPGPSMARAA